MKNRELVAVELIHEDFEIYWKNKPSGHYARGEIIKWYDDKLCLIELFCNGIRYRVDKTVVKLIPI